MVNTKLISASITSITMIFLAVPACSGLLSIIMAAMTTNMSKVMLISNMIID
jgi:hypothetical protein